MDGWKGRGEEHLSRAVESLVVRASVELPPDVEEFLRRARAREENPRAVYALEMILENARIAGEKRLPLCQDTGMFHLFVEAGCHPLPLELVRMAADEGVRRATAAVPLRSSVVEGAAGDRRDRGDNTPVHLHFRPVDREGMRLTVLAKGGGSENATRLCMLLPGEGVEGVKREVIRAVREKAAQACPPVVVGVGIGGDALEALEAALFSLLRPLGERNGEKRLARLEEELLREINGLGIGAAGLGGVNTALDVHVEEMPTHIACLPVGVVISCHSLRRASMEMTPGTGPAWR